MVNLQQLLKAMVEQGASDLHITTGTPPQLRIDGVLVPLRVNPLSPVDTKQLCYSVLTEEQKVTFEKKNELDLSFGISGLGRFRVNVFQDRYGVGAVFRAIPSRIPTIEELGLPPIMREFCMMTSVASLVTLSARVLSSVQ